MIGSFSSRALRHLHDEIDGLRMKHDDLQVELFNIRLSDAEANNYLRYGVQRRLSIIESSVQTIFDELPPEQVEIPESRVIDNVTICLHANIFNVFGLLDCLAHIWAKELNVLLPDGSNFPDSQIGFSKKQKKFRSELTPRLLEHLNSIQSWFHYLENYRHALAHRIPPYVPPYMVDPSDEEKYVRLRKKQSRTRNTEDRKALEEEIRAICHFKAMLVPNVGDHRETFFHPQLLTDFLTVSELCRLFFEELKSRQAVDMIQP